MMAVLLGCNVNAGKGVGVAVEVCVVVAVSVEVLVCVGKGVPVKVEDSKESFASVTAAVVSDGWVTVFFAFGPGRIISVGEAVAAGIEATRESVVMLMDETTGVIIKANARGAATMLREVSARLK
jgi:hypothetical protein